MSGGLSRREAVVCVCECWQWAKSSLCARQHASSATAEVAACVGARRRAGSSQRESNCLAAGAGGGGGAEVCGAKVVVQVLVWVQESL